MNIKDKFLNILNTNTRYNFHDATLLSFNIILQKQKIIIEIEHNKDGKNENEEEIYLSTIIFHNFEKIKIINDVECLGIKDEISVFDADFKNDETIFSIIGIHGWEISFVANDFSYNEVFKKIVRF